jgi:hypothetical protein
MIDVSRFASDRDAIDHILAVDADPAARLALLSATPFRDNREPDCLADDYLAGPLLKLIDGAAKPGRRRYRHRTLREHAYASPLRQSIVSLGCRFDGLMWKVGRRLGINR